MRSFLVASLLLFVGCLFLASCRSYVFIYPYPWDRPKAKPDESDLVGTYEIRKLRITSGATSGIAKDARITLKRAGTAIFTNVPQFDMSGLNVICNLSGSVSWRLDNKSNGAGWSVDFHDYRSLVRPVSADCDLKGSILDGIVLSGRHPPYRLYEIVGDRDSDTGVEFARNSE